MKVAIFEPDPRVCGPLTWAGHMKAGFTAIGVQLDTVSATKSGRNPSHWGNVKTGGKWWATRPDRISRMDQVHHILDEYDLIILPEPKSPLADKLAIKADDGSIPWYVEALQRTRTPFTTALHGNPYTEKNSPFADFIVGLDNFTGAIIAHTAPLRTVTPAIGAMKNVQMELPYAPRNPVDAPFPRGKTVGSTGRFMFNKGSHVVGLSGAYLPPDVTVEVWGSCSVGRGPNLTYNLYEAIKPWAEPGQAKRYHNSDGSHPKATEDGNIVQPFLYDVRIKDHALVRYLGNYVDPLKVAARLTVHVNLTSSKYTSGMEFSTLEALDAGSLCITPPHCSQPEMYRTLVIDPWKAPAGSVTSALKTMDQTYRVSQTIEKALGFLDLPEEQHRAVVESNREALRKYPNPATIAQMILDECR